MDVTIIEKEVNNFCVDFFRAGALESQECMNFIKQNNLYSPKENYTILIDFLDSVLKRFKVLDSEFVSTTLEKVIKDVIILQNLLTSLKEDSDDVSSLFNTKFIISSEVLTGLLKGVESHKLLTKGDSEKKQELEHLESIYTNLKNIYAEIFNEMFYKDKKHYLHLLMQALNFKVFCYDKLLWKEAAASNFIIKHFQVKEISTKLDSEHYLQYLLSMMRPYTEKYEYYQACIRIFK